MYIYIHICICIEIKWCHSKDQRIPYYISVEEEIWRVATRCNKMEMTMASGDQ